MFLLHSSIAKLIIVQTQHCGDIVYKKRGNALREKDQTGSSSSRHRL
jgi:hypothetical protein